MLLHSPLARCWSPKGTTVEPGCLQGGEETVMSLLGLQTLLGRLFERGRKSFRGGCGCVSRSFEDNHGERDSPLTGAS